MFCDLCGAENSEQATNCAICGQPLQVQNIGQDATVADGAAQAGEVAAGTLLNGHYQIIACVGRGGFGSVYKARDTRNGRIVAVKSIFITGLQPQEVIEATAAFHSEVQTLSSLKRRGLPRLYEHFNDAQHWYLVMDFIEGHTLEHYLEQCLKREAYPTDRETLREMAQIGIEVCSVLKYMHQRHPPVIFRDLKPANIMIDAHKNVSLIDFGIARHFKPGQARDTIPLGSPGYAAPEQYGKSQTTPRSDIYSLGAILHQMFTGRDPSEAPFHFVPVRTVNTCIPEDLSKLIMQMVDLDPAKRPGNVGQVREALKAYVETLRVPANQPTSQGNVQTKKQQQRKAKVNVQGGRSGAGRVSSYATRQARPRTRRRFLSGLLVGAGLTVTGVVVLGAIHDATSDEHSSSSSQTTHDTMKVLSDMVLKQDFSGPTAAVTALSWQPGGQIVAIASADHNAYLWNPFSSPARSDVLRGGHTQAITSLAWASTGTRIATGSLDRSVRVWSATSQAMLLSRTFPQPVTALAWQKDGDVLAVGCADGTVYICDSRTLAPLDPRIYTYKAHQGAILSMDWSHFDDMLATASADYTVKIWQKGKKIRTYTGHSDSVNAVAWSFADVYLASASNDHTLQIWDAEKFTGVATYTQLETAYDQTPTPIAQKKPVALTALAWQTMDNDYIVCTGVDGSLHILNGYTAELVERIQSAAAGLHAASWSYDDSYLIVGGTPHQTYLYQPKYTEEKV